MKDRPDSEPEYKSRVAIYEVMEITQAISQLIMKKSPESELQDVALKQGMLLMKQDGYIKALEGITTIEEVIRVAEVK
jgi:type IV pilus assembly protein PilB